MTLVSRRTEATRVADLRVLDDAEAADEPGRVRLRRPQAPRDGLVRGVEHVSQSKVEESLVVCHIQVVHIIAKWIVKL